MLRICGDGYHVGIMWQSGEGRGVDVRRTRPSALRAGDSFSRVSRDPQVQNSCGADAKEAR